MLASLMETGVFLVINLIQNNNLLVIDCQTSGVAGDMILGALIDIGANVDRIVDAIGSLEKPVYGYKGIKIQVKQVIRGEFRSTNIDVTSDTADRKLGKELIEIVDSTVNKLELSVNAKKFASRTIRTLVNTEEKLHKNETYDGIIDEVSLVDTAAEIIGSAVALDDLSMFNAKIFSTPVAVGGGTFKISHGIISSPAPATLAILQSRQFPFHGGPIEAELATPTGAAILVNLVDEVQRFYPAIVPLKVGYGAGTKDFAELPDVLRLTFGKLLDNTPLKLENTNLETETDSKNRQMLTVCAR
jgi:pyridinium-3,5-bisthiocarboxylic acid mononucleotide nickel chelatase